MDGLSIKSDPSRAFDKKRYGLNSWASFPQLESSICTNRTGTTSTAPAGMVAPVLRLKSGKNEAQKKKTKTNWNSQQKF